jgi:hypothetical protein
MEMVQGYYKKVGLFCKTKDFSPQRRKERKGKLKIWEKDERQKTWHTDKR